MNYCMYFVNALCFYNGKKALIRICVKILVVTVIANFNFRAFLICLFLSFYRSTQEAQTLLNHKATQLFR